MTTSALIRPAWTPATIALMVIGFMVFWPLGLAMLAYIIWGDRLEGFKTEVNRATDDFFGGIKRATSFGRGTAASAGFARSGNVAFDEWREAEMKRLEEERRKLDTMRAEFDAYVRELHRAKDQEEFNRFMREHRASSGTTPTRAEIDA
ncbi:DUF2852 domain-containing protein [Pararhizobium mangrovi]|uniref:DUF2852 domain-containing protein n=1 Tax=Pararhizobium mangrovi TaxID=2590452 RepID=A0A506U5Y6_9HYPH|nr:DUF2852 domain-containing protein [Pararhizobium mangrovi]TPW28385.1 DUF2852 domain-containing protein [Pararhizobium mangrovi]